MSPAPVLLVRPMQVGDLTAVQLIERASFTTPWPVQAYRQEIETNRLAQYLVALIGDEIVAYGGIWLMVDEAHVTTFAVHPRYRRRRIGERLLLALLDLAVDRHAREATLEVRLSNLPARRLYEKYGFRPVGIRPRYYSDNGEDALIMTTEPLELPAMRARIARLRAAVDAAPAPDAAARRRALGGAAPMSGPLLLAIESSCDETGIALVEDGRRIHANIVASQVALHAPTGGIVPEVAARAHLRWIVPVLDEALATAGVTMGDVDGVAVTYGPGLAGSLLVGINFAKTIAWAHGKPLVPVNHLEGHLYAGWLLDPGEAEREVPPFPLVGLVVSGGHTFLVEMRGHLDYRYLGGTVDDAAGEAFDKVGRLLGLGYPGRAGHLGGRRPRHRARPRLSAGMAGRFVRRQLLGAQDRGAADRRRRPAPRPGCRRTSARARCPTRRSPSSPGASRTVSWTCSTPRRSGRPRRSGARGIVLGGGVAANAALRSRIVRRGRGARDRAGHPAAGPVHRQRGDDRRGGGTTAGGWRPGWARPRRAALAAARPVSDLRLDPRHVQRTLRAAGLHARHNLSQNFLADVDVLEGILREAGPGPGRGVLEIGPGLGFLTGGLLASGAAVTAVELDRGLAAFIGDAFAREVDAGQLRVIQGDALDQDLVHLVAPPYDVVANLPYHITSPVLHRLLGAAPRAERLVLMVQREVAERVAAAPGDMSYLSVFVQYHARARVAFRVSREAFEPAPKVESAVLVLEPYATDDRLDADAEDHLWRIVQAGFRERRKMLHNVLRRQLPVDPGSVDAALAAVGIAPDRRPQTVAVGEWIALAQAIGPIPDGR